jgi:hypothetical protein
MQHDDDPFMQELRFRVEVMRRQKKPDLRDLLPPQLIRSAIPTNQSPKPFGHKD